MKRNWRKGLLWVGGAIVLALVAKSVLLLGMGGGGHGLSGGHFGHFSGKGGMGFAQSMIPHHRGGFGFGFVKPFLTLAFWGAMIALAFTWFNNRKGKSPVSNQVILDAPASLTLFEQNNSNADFLDQWENNQHVSKEEK